FTNATELPTVPGTHTHNHPNPHNPQNHTNPNNHSSRPPKHSQGLSPKSQARPASPSGDRRGCSRGQLRARSRGAIEVPDTSVHKRNRLPTVPDTHTHNHPNPHNPQNHTNPNNHSSRPANPRRVYPHGLSPENAKLPQEQSQSARWLRGLRDSRISGRVRGG
ncbi:MAG: hypothetical protein RL215_2181, partial [Planctomycetota bacterium]